MEKGGDRDLRGRKGERRKMEEVRGKRKGKRREEKEGRKRVWG